eukprot:6700881-Prymnesium_polylepis.1
MSLLRAPGAAGAVRAAAPRRHPGAFGSGDGARRAMMPRVWFGRWRPEGYDAQSLVRTMAPRGL